MKTYRQVKLFVMLNLKIIFEENICYICSHFQSTMLIRRMKLKAPSALLVEQQTALDIGMILKTVVLIILLKINCTYILFLSSNSES